MNKRWNITKPSDWPPFLDTLMRYRDAESKITITVEPYRKRRSPDQNRFYFGCVVRPLAEVTGYTEAEMHDEILGAYVGWETRKVNGHVREYPRRRSTSPETMDTMDFSGLIQTGQQIASNLGIVLPDQEQTEEVR